MLCYFRFVIDAMFSHDGASGPESKKTPCFVQFAADGGTWGEIAISDRRLVCSVVVLETSGDSIARD